MSNTLPEEAIALMEQFVRDISKTGCAVFGVIYRVEPEPGIALMRNTSGNPVHTLNMLRDIVQQACDDNRIEDRPVLPEN